MYISIPAPLSYLTYYSATPSLLNRLSSYIVADLELVGDIFMEHYENEIEEISVIYLNFILT